MDRELQRKHSSLREVLLKSETKAEKAIRERLAKKGISYIRKKGFLKDGFYCVVDFYLPRPFKVCIDIDAEEDSAKEAYINSRGLRLVRLTAEEAMGFNPAHKKLASIVGL